MDQRQTATPGDVETRRLLQEARREAAVLGERLTVLSGLLDRALGGDSRPGGGEDARQGPVGAAAPDGPEGARLVALNMALAGSSRGDAQRWLASASVAPEDAARILDDVFGG
jgi:hypothetical protein